MTQQARPAAPERQISTPKLRDWTEEKFADAYQCDRFTATVLGNRLRYTVAQDVGRAIHPDYVEGQMQGGVVQGIGWALNEEYFVDDDGTMANSSFLDYRMPTSLDLPMIDTVIVEVANPSHPYGVRGVGEASIVPCLAAIANAIYDATGVRMYQLPMSPSAIFTAIEGRKRN